MAGACCSSVVVLIHGRIDSFVPWNPRRKHRGGSSSSSSNIVRRAIEDGDAPGSRTGRSKKSQTSRSTPRKKPLGGRKQEAAEVDSDYFSTAGAPAAAGAIVEDEDGEFSSTRSLFRGADEMGEEERDLRFSFLESLMGNARSGNIAGVEEVISEMNVIGLKPGPRAYHGVVAAYARANDVEGAINALQLESASGETPLPETFLALGRMLGRSGLKTLGEKLIGTMERCKLDARYVWNVTVEELFKAGQLNDANALFLKGLEGGFKATDNLYDVLVERNCQTANHGVAVDILRRMEAKGRFSTTFHYNCLLLAQGNAGFPEIAADTFEEMQHLSPHTKPDTESYNLVIQAETRTNTGERVNEVINYLGMMLDDHPRVKPNARTYTLLIECYIKFNLVDEALRHFRALTRFFPGSLRMLHSDGQHGDPLSLLLRSLSLEGRIVQLVEVLDLMKQEGLKITKRAMFMNRKGRTLVSSWVEPIQQEADIGCEVDFIGRYIAEGGLTGERKRWIPTCRKRAKDYLPDYEGYRFFPPGEKSYKQFCADMRRKYKRKLITLLEYEGVPALGEDATREEYDTILERLKKETYRKKFKVERKPKAASKLSVPELREELEAQGLPTDGNRSILYQRVQKARRINVAKGQPLWMPPEEETFEELDEEFEASLSKIDLTNPRQKYRQKCFIEGVNLDTLLNDNPRLATNTEAVVEEPAATDDETETEGEEGDVVIEEKDDEDFDGDDDFLETSSRKKKDDDESDVEEPTPAVVTTVVENSPFREEGSYVKTTLAEKRQELIEKWQFDFSDLDEIEEIWGWTWERKLQAQAPELWARKHEVELGIQVLQKVVELGGNPTVGDCAMHIQNAMKIPWPTAMVTLIRESHKIGHKFGSKLYEDAVACCLSLQEKDAAVAILTDMEDAGVTSSDLVGRVLPDSSSP